MRKISGLMSKIGLVEGDTIRVNGQIFDVVDSGYLVPKDKLSADIRTTADVLFGVVDFEYVNLDKITESDYYTLKLLKRGGFKYVLYNGLDLFASLDIRKGVQKVPFVSRDKETKFKDELVYGKYYLISFLLKRYKNRVLE